MHNTMSRDRAHINNRLRRVLQPHTDADGPYISLPVLLDVLPAHRWDMYLLGITASNKADQVMRTQPLLGRKVQATRIVVLVSSLREWLTHYNPDKPVTVAGMIDGLQLAEKQYQAGLNRLRAEVAARDGAKAGRRPAEKVAQPKVGVPKATSDALWRVW